MRLRGVLILDQRLVKLKENREEGSTTEAEVPKANETTATRELYREFAKFRKTPIEIELARSEKLKEDGGPRGKMHDVNSIGRIDQLGALRFNVQSRKRNSTRTRGDGISEHEAPRMRKEIQKGETYNKYGRRCGEIETGSIGGECGARGMHFLKYRNWVRNWVGFVYALGIIRHPIAKQKQALTLAK